MKKYLISLILTSFLSIFAGSQAFALKNIDMSSLEESKKRSEKILELKDNNNIPAQVYNADFGDIELNIAESIKYNAIVYGDHTLWPIGANPRGFTERQEKLMDLKGNEQYKFIGITMFGDVYVNPNWEFNDYDLTNPTSFLKEPWLNQPWNISSDYLPPTYNNWGVYSQISNGNPSTVAYDTMYYGGNVGFYSYMIQLYVQTLSDSVSEARIQSGQQNVFELSSSELDFVKTHFSVISPRTQYTPFVMIGYIEKGGQKYSKLFTLPPLSQLPNLSIKISDIGCNLSKYAGSGPYILESDNQKFKATVLVELVDSVNFKLTKPVQVVFTISTSTAGATHKIAYLNPGDLVPNNSNASNTALPSKIFTFEWSGSYGDTVMLDVELNPAIGGQRELYELTYADNVSETHAQFLVDLNSRGGGTLSYSNIKNNYVALAKENLIRLNEKGYDPRMDSYTKTDNGYVKNDEKRIFLYKENTITMETSNFVDKLSLTFTGTNNVKYLLILKPQNIEPYSVDEKGNVKANWIYQYKQNSDGTYTAVDYFKGPYGGQPFFWRDSVKVNKESKSSTAGYKYIWTLTFSIKANTIYSDIKPDETRMDTIQVTAYDVMGQTYKEQEVNPLNYLTNIRPAKLFNLRIFDVKDIYWKAVFNDASGNPIKYTDLREAQDNQPPFGPNKLPLKTVPKANNRLISKGYAVQFKIDSEGFYNEGDRISITPTFWWYGATATDSTKKYRQVDLYYDVVDNPLGGNPIYNIPVETTVANKYYYQSSGDNSNLTNKVMKYYVEANKSIESLYGSGFDEANNDKAVKGLIDIYNYYIHNLNKDYAKIELNATKKYFEGKILLSGRGSWEFSNNTKQNLTIEDGDQYYTKFKDYRNTWTFTYTVHPKVKAFLKGTDYNPFTTKPLTGPILVNFNIQGYNFDPNLPKDSDQKPYNYTNLEEDWKNMDTFAKYQIFGNKQVTAGHGNVFYFNLDASALNDYTTQQKW